jgi:Pectinesterase
MGQFRFVHIGVAAGLAAATLSAVGVVRDVGAAGNGTPSVFVPIVPCRLADTRPGASNVGTRNSPAGPAETLQFVVWGSNGNCAIPNTATGIATNVTAVGPTADSYLTVFPADANPRPTSSNLNVTSTSPPTPNQVTVALSATGAIAVYNNGGTVDVIVDIVGYYIPSTGSGTGPAGPQGPTGPQGPVGPSGVTPRNVIWVAKSGGQFTSVRAAMDSITDASSGNPYLVKVAPGIYTETVVTIMKSNVDLEGSGQDRTIVTCACGGNGQIVDATIFVGNIRGEIRDITITNTGRSSGNVIDSVAVDMVNTTSEMSIVDTTMTATNAPTANAAGVYLEFTSMPHIDNINIYTSGAGTNYGVKLFPGATAVIRNSWIYISGPGNSVAGNAQSRLVTSTVNGVTSGMVNRCDLVLDVGNNPYICT